MAPGKPPKNPEKTGAERLSRYHRDEWIGAQRHSLSQEARERMQQPLTLWGQSLLGPDLSSASRMQPSNSSSS